MAKRRDILKELRSAPAVLSNIGPPVDRILREAADEIESLRTVLKPFANWAMKPGQKPTLEECNAAHRVLYRDS
jgi:hypothetical protein